MKVSVLASGSSGNCIAVQLASSQVVLIDAGIPRKICARRLHSIGLRFSNVVGLLRTHEHSDHWGHAESYFQCGVRRPYKPPPGVSVITFPVPHDALSSVGYRITEGASVLVVISDAGCITDVMDESMKGADVLVVNCDYDEEMLAASNRPDAVKQRTASNSGHLSNQALAAWLSERWDRKAHTIILAHLSLIANSPSRAWAVATEATAGSKGWALSTGMNVLEQLDARQLIKVSTPESATRLVEV